MADKSRTVNTKFWTDSYIEQLNPSEKLLFLYCLTSPQSNLLGIYEVSESRIKFETGLNIETIRKGFERFGKDSKVYYKNNFIIIPNFLAHQRLNSNMKIGVTKLVNDLPEWLKQEIFGNDLKGFRNHSESFEIIRNTLLKLEIEIESEIESEKEKENLFDFEFDESFKDILKEWFQYKKDRKESYKNKMSRQKFYTKLYNLSNGNVDIAQKIIDQSMANNWAGIFELKDSVKQKKMSIGMNKKGSYDDD